MFLVPCKVRYSGPTAEFQSLNHIRGRKIVGKDILSKFPDSNAYLARPDNVATLNAILNCERDGNDQRLLSELHKFHENLDLNDAIHGTT
ncbi:AFR749Cp [Eremothecium gossypii ATCC 10895]|uniref:AFR643W-Bp n=1 Tax=Eremothecium gossypii (strain ATCC 10895 / CBS 109.51 / FGSC 9923 / NRRL Y-1056) TaxID=284811 RepID=D8FGE5_EREGS|nr:AFR643W-Bp [Eremothecium gossypii ATCC 10895]NP_001342286.1 AFR749Cp [Eremothecium gossypii ATCC 10895]ADJ41794.1 AFR643W-Bp [Eremothecium gossypii ATCC 10895]ADJ41796.1 AFR749Cp [Eremothecium gossypii ATCC 10895]